MCGRGIQFALYAVVLLLVCPAIAGSPPVKKLTLPKTKVQCLAAGGEWILQGPQMVTHGCMLKTGDGGKSCKTSAQCQAVCIEYSGGNHCAEYVDGCYSPTGRGTVTQCVN